MQSTIRNVLVVAVSKEEYDRLEPLLRRASFDVDRVPSTAGARSLLGAVAFDIVVLGYPLPDQDLGELLDEIRAEGSPCRRSAVLVLAPPDLVEEVRRIDVRGFVKVLTTAAPAAQHEEVVASLLRVAPRLSVRLPIRLEVQLGDGTTQTISQTENVSAGGMLVRSTRLYPVDSPVRFELFLPDDKKPVSGGGEVVRHVDGRPGRLRGFGVRFLDFARDGRERLQSFIRAELATRQRANLFPDIG